jgi:hypothetical protein
MYKYHDVKYFVKSDHHELSYQGPVNVLRRQRFFCAYGLLTTSRTCLENKSCDQLSKQDNSTMCIYMCKRICK